MKKFVTSAMKERGQVLTFDECIDRFQIEDAILVSRTNDSAFKKASWPAARSDDAADYVAEYTERLLTKEFWKRGKRVHRYRVLERAELPNGRIVIAP